MVNIGSFEAAARAVDPDTEPDTFTLSGPGGVDPQTFTIAADPNIVALGRFAKAASAGADTGDMDSLATLIDTVASCVILEDEHRFLDHASKHRVDADVLLQIVAKVMEVQAGRPTEPSSDSSAGRSTTTANSKVPSSSEEPSASTPQQPSSWRDTPFGRRELAAHPEEYEDMQSVRTIGHDLSQVG